MEISGYSIDAAYRASYTFKFSQTISKYIFFYKGTMPTTLVGFIPNSRISDYLGKAPSLASQLYLGTSQTRVISLIGSSFIITAAATGIPTWFLLTDNFNLTQTDGTALSMASFYYLAGDISSNTGTGLMKMGTPSFTSGVNKTIANDTDLSISIKLAKI